MRTRQKRKKKRGFAARAPVRLGKGKQRAKTLKFIGEATGLIIPVDFELNIEEGLEPLSDEAIDRIQTESAIILDEYGQEMETTAKQLVPVRTGNLRESIRHERADVEHLWLQAEAPYAAYVEYGTRKMTAQPYLEPAIEQHQAELQAALDNVIFDIVSEDAEKWQDDPELELELATEAWTE